MYATQVVAKITPEKNSGLKGLRHEDFVVLGQFKAKIINQCL